MSDELLKPRICNLSDDELLKMVHVDFADYREEAIVIAKDELKKRNINLEHGTGKFGMRDMEWSKKQSKRRRPRFFLGPIDSMEHADYIIRSASQGFYVLAALQMLIGIVLMGGMGGRIQAYWGMIDVVVYATGGFFLSRTKKVGVALFLIFWTGLVFIQTFLARVGYIEGGGNIVLAFLALWIAFRGYKATAYLRSSEQSKSSEQEEERLREEARIEAEVARLLKEQGKRNSNA